MNILVFQPYLSNRMLSSGTVERQFRFLKRSNSTVYVLLDESEAAYAEQLKETGWITPIVLDLHNNVEEKVIALQEEYKFITMFIARTYFTPCTEEHLETIKNRTFDEKDFRYIRNLVPILFAEEGVSVHHVIYDPLEMKYDTLIKKSLYSKCSSMNNVEGALEHSFADVGYYDLGKEVLWLDKTAKFTFGATSVEPERTKLLEDLYRRVAIIEGSTMYMRTHDFNNLVPNEVYEEQVSKSLFTYTVPSYDPKHMSFTRMLLALSQGTIPLLHPDNNLDCLFGEGFSFRNSLRPLFEKWTMTHEELEEFLKQDMKTLVDVYVDWMAEWQASSYYKWLQENC